MSTLFGNSEGFDTEINNDYHSAKFDTQSNLVNDVLGGALATVVDAGASLWNSIPFTPEASTADLLSGISDNALRVYEENPETIHTASFIAGSLVPGGLAIKGMNAIRNGSKAVNWFTTAGKRQSLDEVASMFKAGAGETTAYRSAVRGIYAKTAVNQAIDAAAFEVAALGAMNAHPYVEDYMKDPVSNFGISILAGGVLGGAVGAIADNAAVKREAGSIYSNAIDFVFGKTAPINPTAPTTANLMAAHTNISLFDAIIKDRKIAGFTDANDLIYGMAAKAKIAATAEADTIFESMMSGSLSNLPLESKEIIKKRFATDAALLGVESFRPTAASDFTVKAVGKVKTAGDLTPEPTLIDITSKKGPTQPRAVEAVYYPGVGFGTKADLKHYAGANALPGTVESWAKDLPYNFGKTPNIDASFELMGKASADVQKSYIAVMEKVDKMTAAEISKLQVSISDGPLISAILAKSSKDPEVAALTIKTFDRSPVYKTVMQQKTEQLIASGVISKTGPTPTYQAAIDKIAGNGNINYYRPGRSGTGEGVTMLDDWISGNVNKMRKASIDYYGLKHGGFGAHNADTNAATAFAELVDSPASNKLRDDLRKLADANGDIFLYRGSKHKGTEQGHAAVVSYTTHATKGAQFGTVRLFKVNVDDVLMGFEDIGSGAHNAEILVRAGARAEEARIDKAGNLIQPAGAQTVQAAPAGSVINQTTTTISSVIDGGVDASLADLKRILSEQKKEAIDTLLAQGAPMQSIALKTNTPEIAVMTYASMKDKTADFLANLHPTDFSLVGSVDDFSKVLNKADQPLVIKGNIKKAQYVQAMASLNNRSLSTINSEITAASMFSSTNYYVQRAAEITFGEGRDIESVRYQLDFIKNALGKANNSLAGNAFINSADFFARNMGDLGPMVSSIGRKWEKLRNDFITEVNKPLAEHMTKISVNKAEVIEFNTFREVNASLKGWRGFRLDEDTQQWNIVQKIIKKDEAGKKITVLEPVKFQGEVYRVVSPSVIDTINYIQSVSPKLLSMANASRKIKGMDNVNDIGLWLPSFNPVNKFIAYVQGTDDSTKILWANTQDQLTEIVRKYKAGIETSGSGERVIEKGVEQREWSRLNGRMDPIHMTVADTSALKTGASASAMIRTDTQVFGEIAGGYEHYINSEMRQLADLAMSDITEQLDKMSAMNRGSFDAQPLSLVKKITDAPKDAAAVMKNTLLGNPNLGEYEGWKSLNQGFESALSMGVRSVDAIWKNTAAPLVKVLVGKTKELTPEAMAQVDYEKVMKEMKDKGIVIWKGFDDEIAKERGFAKLEDSPDISKRIVYASNALAATMMLRVGELAQPLVNMMSLPILTSLAAGSEMPAHFLGVAKATANVSPTQVMYEGMRASMSQLPVFTKLEQRWIREGYFDSVVSEANKTLSAARSMSKGAIATTEKMLDSNIINWMSKPADFSEKLVRRQTMFTGAVLAKRLYPELDDAGVTIFARDFMDKAVGNFEASQRPVFFQGTLGVALGLFQTYSVTLAQNMYRQLELKNYKNLMKAMALQSGIFGTTSMPGFSPVSQLIGEHFSDDHYDLVTGTYRALPDKMAQSTLYGLPSLSGVGLFTRGDSNFRAPGIDGVVAINAAQQIVQAVGGVASAMGQGSNAGQAMLQALSLQNISRPLARTAEIATGYSVTRQGNTVQTPDEVWTTTGIISRVLGARPVEEAQLREYDHLNTFYGSVDRENRQAATIKLKNAIRNGNLTDEGIADYADVYMRNGGSPRGWQAAVNEALGRTNTSGKETFVEKLKPTSPFMHMMNGLDGAGS